MNNIAGLFASCFYTFICYEGYYESIQMSKRETEIQLTNLKKKKLTNKTSLIHLFIYLSLFILLLEYTLLK